MKAEKLTLSEALDLGRKQPFALIRSFSAFSLGPTPGVLPPREELLEARFFSESEEYRIIHNGEDLIAVKLTEEPGEDLIDTVLEVENKRFGKKIRIRQIVCFDEDGQAVLGSARLCGWEGGEQDG